MRMADKSPTGVFRRSWELPKRGMLVTASLLAIVLIAVYRIQPDILAAFILIPPWVWLIPALLLLTFGRSKKHRRWTTAAVFLWSLFLVLIIDEIPSLLRQVTSSASIAADEGQTWLRVVSLNCYFGRAASEVKALAPDIVLFQESPDEKTVEQIARDLYGDEASVLWNWDTSIICRGQLRDPIADRRKHFALATLALPDGTELEVVSTRLDPPIFDVDFWTSAWWLLHRDRRRDHRRQSEELVAALAGRDQSHPVILGGDMNSPANDAGLWPLRERLYDTFPRAGRGLGNTGPTDSPFWRVDQIWMSRQLDARRVTVQPVPTSDHRMVICDFLIAK